MRVLVLEAVCAGLCGGNSSLLREGAAMWQAVTGDLARLPGVAVQTCLDERLRGRLIPPHGVECFWSTQPGEHTQWWNRGLAEADAALIIAPETGGLLHTLVRQSDGKALNCTPDAIALCTDKLRLADHCERHGVASIPTRQVDWRTPPAVAARPCVVKPVDGAGCWLTRSVSQDQDWQELKQQYQHEGARAVWQPLIHGRHVSVAGVFHASRTPELWPVAEQDVRIDDTGTLHYFGGRVPADIAPEHRERIAELVRSVAATIPGLRGYVGFDLMLPDDRPEAPLLVEINPRLTTSYIGYRQLCEQNLAAALLRRKPSPLTWRDESVQFTAAGAILNQPEP